MTNLGIKSSQLSDIRAALLDSSKNNTLEPRKNENFGNHTCFLHLEMIPLSKNSSKTKSLKILKNGDFGINFRFQHNLCRIFYAARRNF